MKWTVNDGGDSRKKFGIIDSFVLVDVNFLSRIDGSPDSVG